MSNRVAIRYAKAISERIQAKEQAEQINNDMKLIAKTIISNAELSRFVKSPVFSTEVKQSVLLEVFQNINQESKFLIRLLAENKRLELLDSVAQAYNDLYDKINGFQKVLVTTAFPITEKLEAEVISKAKKITSDSLIIQNIIDPSIIGGFIIRIGDKQYNASVANRLKRLKRELMN